MRCKNFKDSIERYADKALSAQKQSAWEEHLRTCSKCSSAYADFNTMKSSLAGIPIPPAPGNLTADIMRSVRNSKANAKKRDEGVLIQWWKEAAVPVRLAFSVVSLIFIAAGVFMGKDLWSAPGSEAYPEYTELDAFSETQKGSLEYGYFQLINTPIKGDIK
jgi:anti-sigma factor RsiW